MLPRSPTDGQVVSSRYHPIDLKIPESLHDNIILLYGESGKTWLRDLPFIVSKYTDKWRLGTLMPFAGLTANFVARSRDACGRPVVVKISPGTHYNCEVNALLTFAGKAYARVYERCESDGIYLMEGLLPGTPLSSLGYAGDVHATEAFCKILRISAKVKPPPLIHFKSLMDFRETLLLWQRKFPLEGPFGKILYRALERFDFLAQTTRETFLLHGDLHQDNILDCGGGWKAIDPKGFVGDPVFEVACFLRNPESLLSSVQDIRPILEQRVQVISQHLSFDKNRILSFGIFGAALAICWYLEDHGSVPEHTLKVAQVLSDILNS
jgi:streptomycin 6-kinase